MSEFVKGIYEVPELDYHNGKFGPADSLSSTEAKRILQAPKVLQWTRDHPQEPKAAYDFGHIVHGIVLGTGLEVVEIPEDLLADNGAASTKAAKKFIADVRADGGIPMRAKDLEAPRAVAQAVLDDPVAGPLFKQGRPEQSIYGQDESTGVWMRGRLDWVTELDGATCLVDLKTTAGDASAAEFTREAAKLEYAVQREFYRQIWQTITGEIDPRFIHVVVSKKPPYLVNVVEMDFEYELIGQAKVRRALDTYKQCLETGEWPGYEPTIKTIGPPAYYAAQEEDLDEMEVA